MAIKKNTQTTTINNLEGLQGLMDQLAHEAQHEAPAREEEPQLDPVMAKAKADGFDINQPHPLVAEFMTGICPFTPEQPQETIGWVLAMATEATGQDETISYQDMILESYKDPTNFIMALARQQGKVNLNQLKRLQKMTVRVKELMAEKADLEDRVSKLKPEAPDVKKIVADMIGEVKGVRPATPAPRLTTPVTIESMPITPAALRPVKVAQTHTPARTEMVRVQVEEPSIWETAAKAAVVGVVTAGAVYGTIKALEYFFGDDEE